ncbi:MAG: D-2-hydroxyacid dehydrogenase family protein, partial [Nitrospinaceae bacterium]|nr:D-2-hydroxyacid dehydrogenase family protein [Nitrospinaceae bacterium]
DAEAVVLIRERTPISDEILEKLPNLKLIAQTARGARHIPLEACTRRGIVVAAGGGNKNVTAELCWGLILAASRNIPTEVQNMKEGRWQTTYGTRLTGKTLGIYAYGGIGNIVAKVGAAFGMNILAWGREGSRERAEADGFKMAASREAFFETSDVVSIHIPLLPDARGIITAGDLGRMKPSALFVNTSRAGLVEEGALEAALKAGRPGSAAVDVYEDEPVLNGNHPLLKLDNCLCSPHLGYVSNESMEQYVGGAFDRVVAFAEGNPIDVINPEVLK